MDRLAQWGGQVYRLSKVESTIERHQDYTQEIRLQRNEWKGNPQRVPSGGDIQ